MSTFTDSYNDTLRIERHSNGDLWLQITDTDDGRELDVLFEEDQVEAVIAAAQGNRPPSETPATLLTGEFDSERDAWNATALGAAITHGREARFSYAKGRSGQSIESRRLVPETVFRSRDGVLIFAGHDPDRDDHRAFRLDRITGYVSVS